MRQCEKLSVRYIQGARTHSMRIINKNWTDFPLGLRQARLARGLSQAQLAEAMNVDQATVSRWERGTQLPEPGVQTQLREFLFRGRAIQDAMVYHFVRSSPGLRLLISAGGVFLAASQPCGGKRLEGRQIADFGNSILRSAWTLACSGGFFSGAMASVRFATDIVRDNGEILYTICAWYPVQMTDGTATLLADMAAIDIAQFESARQEGIVVTPLEAVFTA